MRSGKLLLNLALEIGGVILLVGCWAAILPRWRLGLELYVLFIPFAGAVEVWLYPASWAVLIKDILFALPAYIGFAMSGELGSALAGIPRSVGAVILLFVGLVLVQTLNPAEPGLFATLIGLKVWLFYVPMMLLGRAYVRDRRSLLRLSRLMVGLIWIPCSVGILQWLLSLVIGYERAISLFYGVAAKSATQGFTQFNNGLMRIPSTFSFPAQYLNYILCMFVPVLGCIHIESDPVWRKIRTLSLWLLCVGGFLSGSRAAFVMIPLILGAFYFLRRGALGALWAGAVVACLLAVTLSFSGIDPTGLLQMETELTQSYAGTQALAIEDALDQTWVGRGVGTNTGAARFASNDSQEFRAFESYYAKAVAELGVAGLAAVLLFQGCLVVWAVRIFTSDPLSAVVDYAAAVAACYVVFLIYNYKGFVIDWDPANMLYWLFAGVLFSLPQVMAEGSAHLPWGSNAAKVLNIADAPSWDGRSASNHRS